MSTKILKSLRTHIDDVIHHVLTAFFSARSRRLRTSIQVIIPGHFNIAHFGVNEVEIKICCMKSHRLFTAFFENHRRNYCNILGFCYLLYHQEDGIIVV